jgi:hypothetical protein
MGDGNEIPDRLALDAHDWFRGICQIVLIYDTVDQFDGTSISLIVTLLPPYRGLENTINAPR